MNRINECEKDQLSLAITDKTMVPAFIVAAKLGIRIAAFCPSAMATLALKLIIDGNGKMVSFLFLILAIFSFPHYSNLYLG